MATILEMESSIRALTEQKDGAYKERNLVLALACRLAVTAPCAFAYRMLHEGEEWEDDWRNIVVVVYSDPFDGTRKQLTWHIHDSELHLFESLPLLPNDWDGHSREEKYERIRTFVRQ